MMLGTRLSTPAAIDATTRNLPRVVSVEAGHATLLHIEGHLDPRALAFARLIAHDPEHTTVVADVPPDGPIELWHAVASLLGKRRDGYRLVLGKHSRDAAVMTGQWLAERLNCPVLVPDGDVVMGAGGTLFSPALRGAGWVRFRRGRAPQQDSRRFPVPNWVYPGAEQIWQPGPVSVVEPLPAGVWIRPLESADEQRHLLISGMLSHRDLLTVVIGSPNSRPVPLAEVVRFCASVPQETRERLRFVQYGPTDVLRSSVGQALADQLGAPITLHAGLPSPAGTLHVVSPEGKLGWRSFARELRYQPRAAAGRVMPPRLVLHDSPMPGATELSPGVYWYAADAVVEVVQSGLWLRPPVAPVDGDFVRTAPIDPRHAALVFDTTTRQTAERMRSLAGEIVARLDPATRRMFRVLPAAVFVTSRAHAPAYGTVTQTVPGKWSAPAEASVAFPVDASVELIAPSPPFPALPAISVESTVERKAIEATVVVSAEVIDAARDQIVLESAAAEVVAEPEPVHAVATVGEPVAIERPAVDGAPAAMPAGLRLESSVPDFGIDFAAIEVAPPAATVEPEPEPAPVAEAEQTPVRVQPVPAAAACAVPPSRGLAEERTWLRKALSQQYDIAASTVSRMLSQVPGLRVGTQADEVLSDLVAVHLYLTGDSEGVDEAVRSAAPGPHVPLARCVASGLKRLPSYRGATQLWAAGGPSQLDWYRARTLVTEWANLAATSGGRAPVDGEIEFRIWSMTARRTQLIDPTVADQVLFVPGTSFKVLDVRDEPTPVVLLRELSSAEIGEDGKVNTGRSMFDDLALGGLDQAAGTWAALEPGKLARPTASAPPGLLSRKSAQLERTSA
jgi:hypothetical protein